MAKSRTMVEQDARVPSGTPARLVFGQHIWCYKCKGLGKTKDRDGKNVTCPHCGGRSILDRGAAKEEQQEDDTG
jgi:rRNA maturation endonuclease Nob1